MALSYVNCGRDKPLRMAEWTFLFIQFSSFVRVLLLCDTSSISNGENCLQLCPENCKSCISDDDCQECKPGYFGKICSHECSSCKDGLCNKVTGHCIEACKNGYYFGTDGRCVKCPRNCKKCVSNTNCPECESGYRGQTCRVYCENCRQGTNCDRSSGYCFEGCADGVTGISCNVACASNCLSCERVDKFQCTICAIGRYGESCEMLCPQTCKGNVCNRYNGTCEFGCIDDFYGTNCELERLSSKTIAVIVVIVLASVGLIITVVILTIIYRWKCACLKKYPRRNKDDESEGLFPRSLPLNYRKSDHNEEIQLSLKNEIPKSELRKYVDSKPDEQYDAEFKYLQSVKEKAPLEGKKDALSAVLVDGYTDRRGYIVCKDPNKDSSSEFWRLVWREKCSKIIMLSSEAREETSGIYLPKEEIKYGDITIETTKQHTWFNSYEKRVITVRKEDNDLVVLHFECKNSPGYQELIELQKGVVMEHTPDGDKGPLLVHCSDGATMSGSFIALDMLIQELESKNCVNIFNCVKKLRLQRQNMIQNVKQYRFLHEALSCYITQMLNPNRELSDETQDIHREDKDENEPKPGIESTV